MTVAENEGGSIAWSAIHWESRMNRRLSEKHGDMMDKLVAAGKKTIQLHDAKLCYLAALRSLLMEIETELVSEEHATPTGEAKGGR